MEVCGFLIIILREFTNLRFEFYPPKGVRKQIGLLFSKLPYVGIFIPRRELRKFMVVGGVPLFGSLNLTKFISKGDLFEWNEWNPAWYARPEGEFEREGTPSYIWMKFVKFWEISWNFGKFWKILENFGKYMYIAKSMRFESSMFELLLFYSI